MAYGEMRISGKPVYGTGSVFERKPLLEPAKACRNPDLLKSEGHAAA